MNGYGPHHILRLIESGKLQEKIENDIGSVYYETSPSHMVRSYVPVDWDLYGPHYTLARDGKEVKYFETNGVIRGLIVPPGNHEVKFIYDKSSFRKGIAISTVAFLLCIGIISFGWVKSPTL